MAKRKRLTPAQTDYLDANPDGLETKSMTFPASRAPIAQVAGDASAAAALQELAGEVKRAKDEGRMILSLQEAKIDSGHLVRDRMIADEDEMQVLMESLRARGQQTPIEVMELPDGFYGLISGWRRLTALRRLASEPGGGRFAKVQAILRHPDTAADAYVAMVEENEIRVGLSYYERARVAAKAVEQGVYETEKKALLYLFSATSRTRRSKIRSFLALYHAADDLLQFPSAIGERLGLALAKQLDSDPAETEALRSALVAATPKTAETERRCLERFLVRHKKQVLKGELGTDPAGQPQPETTVNGITLGYEKNTLTLRGPRVDEALRQRLLAWLTKQD